MAHADFSRIFVDRPILATVFSVLILVAGLIAIPNLPISEYPDVVPPSVLVTAIYPGANPRTIAETVAGPIEEVVNGVEGMIYMKSTSSSDGVMQLTVTFEAGTDIDLAAVQVQNRVAQALPRLPEAVRALGVTTVKSSPTLTMVVHVTSPDGRYDELYLSNFASLRIRDELSRIQGVGQAFAFGAGVYAMRIWIDPEKAAARDLTATDIILALREQNVEVSAGALGGPPTPAGSVMQLPINVQGRLDSPEAFGDIVLKTERDGADPAQGRRARRARFANSYALRSLLNNENAAAIVIFEAPGANTLELSAGVRAKMAELAKGFPEGIQWQVVYDPTVFVRESINSVVITLLEAVALVVIVVVLFLQTWRASLIPLIAVPVSIVGTFAVLWSLGYSINVLTLFGLVLAIGIVVDDAIVVVENVERHIEEGMKPRDAAHQAMSEVSGPIIAISLVLAVGVRAAGVPRWRHRPVLPAVRRDHRRIRADLGVQFADAVAGAGRGAAEAPRRRAGCAGSRHRARLRPAVSPRSTGVFKRGQTRYSRRHRRHHRARAAAAGDLRRADRASPSSCFRAVPGGFIPTQDKQYLFGALQLPEGATHRPHRGGPCASMGDIALATPGVESVVQFPGLNAVHFVNTPNVGVMFIGLEPQRPARDAGRGDRRRS